MTQVPSTRLAENLAVVLMRWRESSGLTQASAAEMIGIERNTLQKLERGWSNRATRTPANPRLSTLVAIAEAMDRPVPDLMADVMFGPPRAEFDPR